MMDRQATRSIADMPPFSALDSAFSFFFFCLIDGGGASMMSSSVGCRGRTSLSGAFGKTAVSEGVVTVGVAARRERARISEPIGAAHATDGRRRTGATEELDLWRRERRRADLGGGRVGDGDVDDKLGRQLVVRPDEHICELDHCPADVKVNLGRAGQKERTVSAALCLNGPSGDLRDDSHDALAHDGRTADLLLKSLDLGLELVILSSRDLIGRRALDELLDRFVVRHADGASRDEKDERFAQATGDVSPDKARRVAGRNGEVVVGQLCFASRAVGEKEAVEGGEADGDVIALAGGRPRRLVSRLAQAGTRQTKGGDTPSV